MKILLLGGGGQIGTELLPYLNRLGEVSAPRRAQLDLADPDALRAGIEALRPDLLVNAAAFTAVDAAESAREQAFRINADAVGVMARCQSETGGWLVHYSTDYVFDGAAGRPYTEEDATAPINVYGASKLAGEALVRASGVTHLILRTSWIYAHHGRNFLLTMLRLGAERDSLAVVDDQIGAPTLAHDVAAATVRVLERCLGPEAPTDWPGTYHLSAAGATSWFEFAREIFRLRAQQQGAGAVPTVRPITSAQFGAPAARPACSLLDNGKLRRRFGVQLEEWGVALRRCLAQLPSPDGPVADRPHSAS